MTKLEIAQHIANVHNRSAQILVNGEGAILMGDTLKELRFLAHELQNDIEVEEVPKEEQARTEE